MSRIALVVVSHSATLAQGVREVARAMAPEVHIAVAGGRQTFDGEGLGTSFDRVEHAVKSSLAEAEGVVIVTDIGSSVMTAESVVETIESDDVVIAHAPLVEGAVAAAVRAQLNGDLREVRLAAEEAGAQFSHADVRPEGTSALDAAFVEAPVGTVAIADGSARASATVAYETGLHARPAVLIAGLASTFTSTITIDGIDATSAMEMMARGIKHGQTVIVEARGADAVDAVVSIVKGIEQPESLG